jgi:hypothetical protein
MAWSDLLMGLVVMPLEIQYSLLEEWRLGNYGCQVIRHAPCSYA